MSYFKQHFFFALFYRLVLELIKLFFGFFSCVEVVVFLISSTKYILKLENLTKLYKFTTILYQIKLKNKINTVYS